ncbi:L,D-transpeptidase family protein [Candidatus Odyssella thessalonicensis]|uniref:L,D-transpeptidase family protein n=1 Tax=Candidatus Odyssella thessalonicensis TaxID=84647 RepID=UPI000225B22B|nr:L,D-transpeptidase family protein [Candidatus Odyssella thessalonicensis]
MANLVLTSPTTLTFGQKEYTCATGSGGIKENKVEGDKATPVGIFGLRYVFYRPDKFSKAPTTRLTCRMLDKHDGWCDDPRNPRYNNHIRLPYNASHEKLWRDDDIYNLIVVTTHNSLPVVANHGSAIFIHVAREGYEPTRGCIALAQDDLLEILEKAMPSTQIVIPTLKAYSKMTTEQTSPSMGKRADGKIS